MIDLSTHDAYGNVLEKKLDIVVVHPVRITITVLPNLGERAEQPVDHEGSISKEYYYKDVCTRCFKELIRPSIIKNVLRLK